MSNSEQSNSFIQNHIHHGIEQVDEATYIITHQVETSGHPVMQPLNQVEELKLIIRQLEQERNHMIESEVLKALKSQEEEFNVFYLDNIQKVEHHFETEIIPLRIKAVENQFYKHQPVSTLTQITSSSTTNITSETIRGASESNEEGYLDRKYEEWKLTYLPVILELKEKEWLERYESVELQQILSKKYQEWENIRLLSILKQQRNKWILEELFAQRTVELERHFQETLQTRIHEVEQYWEQVVLPQRISADLVQWNANQQQLLSLKIRQVEDYWEKVILPERLTQSRTLHSSELTTASYTPEDLDHILIEEHHKWQSNAQHQIQTRLGSYQQDWQLHVLPQIKLQWQQQQTSNQPTHSLATSQIDQIINQKYQEWKLTYLPEYLALEKIKWLEEYTKNQLETIIKKKQEEWETVRLLSIIKQPRNHWIIDTMLKEKLPHLENTILIEQRRKWELVLLQNTKEWEASEERRRKDWELKLQRERSAWQGTVLMEKRADWERQYLRSHPQQKQIVVKQVIKQVDIQGQINKYEAVWLQKQESVTRHRMEQVERYWSKLIEQQRLNFDKNLQFALSTRTTQIETYWQQVMIPQIKDEWPKAHLEQLRTVNTQDQEETYSRRVHEEVTRRLNEEVTRRLNEEVTIRVNQLLQIEVEKRTAQWFRIQLPKILEQRKIEWSAEFTQTQQFTAILLAREQELTKLIEAEFGNKLKRQRVVFDSELESVRSQNAVSLVQLERALSQREYEYGLLHAKLMENQKHQIQSQKSAESIGTKETIEKLKMDQQKLVQELKITYEQKISHINHEKSLLLIQIKELEMTLQTTQNQIRPKQSLNLTVIQSNYDKQLLSLEATIKTKQSQANFLKKSTDALTLQNQDLNSRIILLNSKIASFQTLLDQTKTNSLKLEYQIKYLKEKEASFNKKNQTKEFEFNQFKSRIEFQKSLLQKKLRQNSSSSQTISTLQLKLNELESQLSMKHSSLKTVENEVQRKRRELEQQKQRSASYMRDFEVSKSSIKQYESVIQDLRLEIRKSCDQINRQKLMIEAAQYKEKSYFQQIKKMEKKSKSLSQSQELIRENEGLKIQISRLRQRISQIESKQCIEIYRLKQTVNSLQTQLYSASLNYREGDITEIQILKNINHEITDLVSTNKQLQMRIVVLENQKQLTAFGISIERFFIAFQEQMDHLIQYFINSQIWNSQALLAYQKFQHKSRQALTHGYIEDYFRQWQNLMRGLIEQNHERNFKMLNKTIFYS